MSVFKKRALTTMLGSYTLLLASGNAIGQVSSGALQQQIESARPEIALPTPQPEIAPPPSKPALKATAIQFVVKQIQFIGNDKISTTQLQDIAKPYLNREVSFEDLNQLIDKIALLYREQGWLVQAYFPKQDVTTGTLIIHVVEARLGNIDINNQSSGRIVSDQVLTWMKTQIPLNEYLSLDDLDRALLTLNDLPDVAATGTLSQGKKTGETDLNLTVDAKPLFTGVGGIDNSGNASTGKNRLTANLNINGLSQFGDQINLYGMATQGLNYGRLSYAFPLGNRGLRFNINTSYMSYRTIESSVAQLNANGTAATAGAQLTYPLIRTRPTNLIGLLNWNYNTYGNWDATGYKVDQSYGTSVASIGASGNNLDSWGGGGNTTGSLIMSQGSVNRNAAGSYDQVFGVSGNFLKLRYALTREQAIDANTSIYGSFSGQLANKNMDSSEQLYFGGPTAVRAYGTGAGPASQGNITTIEVRRKLPYAFNITAFYDYGNVTTWKNNPLSNNVSNSYVLQGLGVGINWLGPRQVMVSGTWAHPTGSIPNSVSQYLTLNNNSATNVFWFNLQAPL